MMISETRTETLIESRKISSMLDGGYHYCVLSVPLCEVLNVIGLFSDEEIIAELKKRVQ